MDHRHADLLLMMGAGFMGYVLPWGQMSFWGATVITGLFGAIPFIGEACRHLLLGGPAVDQRDAEPFLLAALSAAIRDCWPCDRSHLGVPHHRQQQPDRC